MHNRFTCINCGNFIVRHAISDPYMCRDCEKLLEGIEPDNNYEKYLENF